MSPARIARGGGAFDRALLRAGRSEDPPRGAEDRALAALGVLGGGAPVSLVVRRDTVARWAGSLKALAILLGLVAGVTGLWVGASRRIALAPAVTAARAASLVAAVTRSTEPAIGVTVSDRAAAPLDAPSPTTASSAFGPDGPGRVRLSEGHGSLQSPLELATPSPGPTRSAPPRAAGGPDLSTEIALVQAAARSLVSGDVGAANRLLDAYDRQFSHGTLAEEAEALRVQVLARSGHLAEARALARKLLDAHPHGVLASRLRSVFDEVQSAKAP